MFEENIETLRPGLVPFPEDVFVSDQPWLADHLWPLLSVDLGLLRPELAGFPRYLNGEADEKNWLDRLGGDFWAGNWVTEDPPAAFKLVYEEEDDRIELTCDGKPMFPVACANGLAILLFYEPESRIALFTFDAS